MSQRGVASVLDAPNAQKMMLEKKDAPLTGIPYELLLHPGLGRAKLTHYKRKEGPCATPTVPWGGGRVEPACVRSLPLTGGTP